VAPLFQPQRQLIGPVQGPVGNKGFTDDKTPAISGYAEPDSIVRLYSWNGIPALPARSKKRMVRLWLPSSNRSGN
jgi:hypothetical protein